MIKKKINLRKYLHMGSHLAEHIIYQIKNTANNRTYIGCTAQYAKRMKSHFDVLRIGKHPSRLMQEDYNKYGKEVFVFSVLAKEQLIFRFEMSGVDTIEKKLIRELMPEYNGHRYNNCANADTCTYDPIEEQNAN